MTSIRKLFSRKESDEASTIAYLSGKDCGKRSASEGRKKRPRVAGGGENLPLEILRCLSEWVSVLDERDTVPGKRFHFERRSIS